MGSSATDRRVQREGGNECSHKIDIDLPDISSATDHVSVTKINMPCCGALLLASVIIISVEIHLILVVS
jgi:hypothetical protein